MRKTKKITLSALLVALGAVFMLLGSFIDIFDLTVCALASLIVVFVYLELGSPYTWLVWLCTSLLAFIICPNKLIAVEYFLVFGAYPLLKAYIERLSRWSWIPVKLGFINAIIWALFFVSEKLFGIPFFESDAIIMIVALYLLMNLAFIAYDMFITVMVRYYLEKLRRRFRRFLK